MKKQKLLFFIMILILINGILFSVDYYIFTNTGIKAYIKPELKSGNVDYSFENGELLSVYGKTNDGITDWYFVNMVGEKKGWVLKNNTYNVQEINNGRYYYEILNREILNNNQYININLKVVEIRFFEYAENNFYGMQYLMKAEDGWSTGSFLYLLTNNTLIRSLAIGGINRSYYFISNYIISLSKIGVSVYDTQLFDEDFESGKNPTGKLYKMIFTKNLLPKNQYEAYDSYMEYNKTNMIITEYLREDPKKPFKVTEYLFQDGKFEKISESDKINNQPSSEQAGQDLHPHGRQCKRACGSGDERGGAGEAVEGREGDAFEAVGNSFNGGGQEGVLGVCGYPGNQQGWGDDKGVGV